MTTITYALCAGRHDIVVDGEDVTEKSVYPMTVIEPLDFKTHIETAREFIIELLQKDEELIDEFIKFRLVVTGLTPVLHAFLKAWFTTAPGHWELSLGHYNRDDSTYVWETLFALAINLESFTVTEAEKAIAAFEAEMLDNEEE